MLLWKASQVWQVVSFRSCHCVVESPPMIILIATFCNAMFPLVALADAGADYIRMLNFNIFPGISCARLGSRWGCPSGLELLSTLGVCRNMVFAIRRAVFEHVTKWGTDCTKSTHGTMIISKVKNTRIPYVKSLIQILLNTWMIADLVYWNPRTDVLYKCIGELSCETYFFQSLCEVFHVIAYKGYSWYQHVRTSTGRRFSSSVRIRGGGALIGLKRSAIDLLIYQVVHSAILTAIYCALINVHRSAWNFTAMDAVMETFMNACGDASVIVDIEYDYCDTCTCVCLCRWLWLCVWVYFCALVCTY